MPRDLIRRVFPSELARSRYRHREVPVAVFCGPSVPMTKARALLPRAGIFPPIKRGDMPRAVRAGFKVVGIIDGTFIHGPTLSGKEIVEALDRGVHLYGAASHGALRAVEFAHLGFIGVGTVYAWFRRGLTYRDDEVVVLMDERNHRPLCEPLVNVRFSCLEAIKAGVISPRFADLALDLGQGVPFAQRSYPRLFGLLRERLRGARLRELDRYEAYVKAGGKKLDVKLRDSVELLALLKDSYFIDGKHR